MVFPQGPFFHQLVPSNSSTWQGPMVGASNSRAGQWMVSRVEVHWSSWVPRILPVSDPHTTLLMVAAVRGGNGWSR